MNTDVARMIAVSALRASSELANLIPLITTHCSAAESGSVSSDIAEILLQIGQRLLRPAFEQHPELEREFDERVAVYGRPT